MAFVYNKFFSVIAIILLLVACYVAYRCGQHSIYLFMSEGMFLLSLGMGNFIYWFSKKNSSTRHFLQISVWYVLTICVVSVTRSALGFDYSILIGCPVWFLFAYLICRHYTKWLSVRNILFALLLPCFILEWLDRVFYWERNNVSFPSSLFFLLGLITGILLYKKRNYITYLFVSFYLLASIWMFTDGYKLWLNKLNYGTFTGRVERTIMKDYQFLNEEGDTVRLSDWKGKKVLIDCWTKYCGICYQKMPIIQRLHERYKESDKVYVTGLFVTYRDDKKEEGAKIVEEEGFSFPVWSIDKTHELLSDLNITGYPRVLLFDEEGSLVFHGNIEGAEEYLKKEVE